MKELSRALIQTIEEARSRGLTTEQIREELIQKTTELDGDLILQHGDMWYALHGRNKKDSD